MLARKFALSTSLAISASLVLAIGPAVAPSFADEVVPPPAVSIVDPTPSPTPTPTPPSTDPKPKPKPSKHAKAKAKAMKVVRAALSRVKHGQYVRGRSGPKSFDCSGLMVYSYRKIGKHLAHSSRALSTRGKKISRKNLKPGDLVFYYSPVHHVAMYIGHGKIVHARNPRNDLDITKLSKYPHYRWARRIIKW
ncbi:MAG TPA: C40 family peptidase [Micropruina sp.]|nr:C40 family peptidase [Micropruina sp.]